MLVWSIGISTETLGLRLNYAGLKYWHEFHSYLQLLWLRNYHLSPSIVAHPCFSQRFCRSIAPMSNSAFFYVAGAICQYVHCYLEIFQTEGLFFQLNHSGCSFYSLGLSADFLEKQDGIRFSHTSLWRGESLDYPRTIRDRKLKSPTTTTTLELLLYYSTKISVKGQLAPQIKMRVRWLAVMCLGRLISVSWWSCQGCRRSLSLVAFNQWLQLSYLINWIMQKEKKTSTFCAKLAMCSLTENRKYTKLEPLSI